MSKLTNRGILFPLQKEPAASRPIADITPPSQVTIPLITGDQVICRPAVGIYETVLQGDLLGIPEPDTGSPVYSPVTGVLADFREIQHPLMGGVPCAVIDCMVTDSFDGKQKENEKSADLILKQAKKMSIIDELDGIPLYNKLSEWAKISPVQLVADGSEQEPYGSSAWSVLNQYAPQVEKGLELAATAAKTSDFRIAVTLPKERREKLKSMLKTARLYSVRGKYPAGLTADSHNKTLCRIGVQACLALYDAFCRSRPQCSVVVTVAGDAVANPQNVRVPIGTSVDSILNFCGLTHKPEYVILGDALTGVAISSADVPVIVGVTCILALKSSPRPPVHACIGCGRCIRACHAGLLPYEIMRRLDNMQYERIASLLPEECDDCGACSYVCPAGLDVAAKVSEARQAQGNIFLKWGDDDDI